MKRLKKLLKKIVKNYFFWIGIVFIFFGSVLFPVKNILFSKLWFSNTIIIFSNEAEQRPCGGFFSVIGEAQNFPFDLTFKNIYQLPKLKKLPVPYKLKSITDTYNFWDTGLNADSEVCVSVVKNFYNQLPNKKTDNVILINYSVLESLLSVVGDITLNDYKVNDKNVFRFLSESVANVDRHNLNALKERKSVLKPIITGVVKKTILQPWKWRLLAKKVKSLVLNGDIYISNISHHITPHNSFGVVEWNVGGGKSSRFLQKKMDIFLREIKPNIWETQVKVLVQNTLGVSEPFGQTWKGHLEILVPDFINEPKTLYDVVLKPGQSISRNFAFVSHAKDLKKLNLFSPRGQKTNFFVTVSVFPQQEIIDSNGTILDFTTSFSKIVRNGITEFYWNRKADVQDPFVTYHERLFYEQLPEDFKVGPKQFENLKEIFDKNDFIVEVHTNEPILIKDLEVFLRDIGKVETFEKRTLKQVKILSDNAFLLAFTKETEQIGEFFEMTLSGITDFWGNKLKPKVYTIPEKNMKN
ncbi:hypothetical protein CSB37_01460 [bacterium DOLZORAL124_38_8]|nr:MAG: hypothetical protein CSB37_01460 [bacterium DOLZORAL124_38_8]